MAARFEKQKAIVYDLISAGEVSGIVGGLSGVYLNDTAIADRASVANLQGGSGTANVSGTAVSAATRSSCSGLFNGISLGDGPRYVQIIGAGKTSTLSTALKENDDTIISAANSIFTSSMIQPITEDSATGPVYGFDSPVKFLVRIPGARRDGGEYTGIITSVGNSGSGTGNKATLNPPIGKNVNAGVTFEIDEVRKISSITGNNTCTLASAVTRSVSSAPIKLSQAIVNTRDLSAGISSVNYESAKAFFNSGTRSQPAHTHPGTNTAASYTVGPNFDLKWHTSQDPGTGQATYFIDADSFSFAQNSKEEVDKVKINIEMPGGLSFTSDNGKHHPAFIELQIVLEYKTDPAQSSFTKELIVGKNYGGSDFVDSVPGRPNDPVQTWAQTHPGIETTRDVYYKSGGSRMSSGVIRGTQQKTAFIKEFEVDLKPFQPLVDWRIGIKRLSPESSVDYTHEDHNVVAMARVKTIEAVIEDNLSYPLSAYSIVEFSAEDFSSIPKRSYHIRGKKVKVPTNYLTREELGSNEAKYTRNKTTGANTNSYVTWDGTFRGDPSASQTVNRNKVYTNNPAWIFYDILTDKEIGLGDFIEESDIDKYALFQIARHCDELVPDGKGGLEPRFTCNVYFAKQEEAYKVLKDLASTFRAMLFYVDGLITPVQDTFKEPVYTFTNGNVEDGIFNYTFTGQRARVNQVNVTWSNPDEQFKQTVVTIDDIENILKQDRVISKDVVAFGVTSEGQAHRVGQWHMSTSIEETEIASFTTAVNAAFLRPGDHINIQDHYVDSIIASGRVSTHASITASSIPLDKLVHPISGFSAGSSHILYLIFPDAGTYLAQSEEVTINSVTYKRGSLILGDASGNPITTEAQAANLVDDSGAAVVAQFSPNTRIEKRFINTTTTSGSGTTIIGTSASFSSAPNKDVIYAIGPSSEHTTVDVKQFRILGLEEESENEKYKITAAIVSTNKYEKIDADRPVYIPDYSEFSGSAVDIPAPQSISAELVNAVSASVDSADYATDAIISWSTPEETITDSSGNTRVIPYRFIDRFEVIHNIVPGPLPEGFSRIEVGALTNSVRIPNARSGNDHIRVRTISDTGAKSKYRKANRRLTTPPPNFNRITKIPLGGTLTTSLEFDYGSGKVLFEEPTYTYITPSSFNFGVLNGNTNKTEQGFNAMSNNTTAYLYYDHNTRNSDPWKAVEVHTDTVAVDSSGNAVNFNYYKEVGATNNGLSATSGTVTLPLGGNTITGSSTSFTSHFSEGDLIKLTSAGAPGTQQSNAEYFEVAEVVSNTSLVVLQTATKTHTGVNAYKQSLVPNFERDAILAQVQKSSTGVYAAEFFVNSRGRRGPGRWQVPVTSLPTTTAQAQTAWDSNWADRPGNAVTGDQATFFEGTIQNFTGTATWSYDGSIWINQAEIIDGDLVVTGSITTDKIFANAITADKIAANSITAESIAADSITTSELSANAVTTDTLAANAITTAKIAANQITTSQIAAGSVVAESVQSNSIVANLLAATTIAACHITTQSLSSLSANLGAITGGTLRSSGANAPPDANSGPSGNESGAFLDLTGGKFTFGNSSKNVTFDGTDLTLSGVVIDASSTVNATATPQMVVEEDGNQEATDIGIMNFTTGFNVVTNSTRATISIDATTSNISEGSRLYFTTNRARTAISSLDTGGFGSFSYNSGTGQMTFQGASAADVRGVLSVATSGDSDLGQLTYDNTVGEYAFARQTAATIRGKVSGGNGITYTSGTGAIAVDTNDGITATGSGVSVDSSVVRTSGTQTIAGNKSFTNNVTIGGNLTVSGATTTINTTNLQVEDNLILLNRGESGSSVSEGEAGIEIDRGSGANPSFKYKETGVGITGDLAAGWTVGTARLAATGFYGTFYGDASNLSNITADSLSGLSTADLVEDPSTSLGATSHSGGRTAYFSNQRAAGAVVAGNGILRGTIGTNGATYSVKAGSGISVDSTGVNVSGVTVAMLAPAAVQASNEAFSDSNGILMTAAAIQDKIQSFGYTTNVGDITGVTATAGLGLTGTSTTTSGNASFTFNIGVASGGGIQVNADSIEVNNTVVRTSGNQTIAGTKTFSSTIVGSITGNADTVDNLHATSFIRSDANDISTGSLEMQVNTTHAINFTAGSTNHARGISFNSRSALSAHYNDGWLRLNQGSPFTNGVYTPGKIRADGGFHVGGTTVITSSGTIPYARLTSTPSIPTVNNSTITFQRNGVTIGTMTLNQTNNETFSFTDTDTNTVTQIRRDNTGTYRTGSINLVGGSNVTITETSAGTFSFAATTSANPAITTNGSVPSLASGITAAEVRDLIDAAATGTGSFLADVIDVNQLNANHISANSITAANIAANAVTASELQISTSTGSGSGIYMNYNGGQPRIDIYDGTTRRVRIGYLS